MDLNNGWLRLWRKLLTKRIWLETDPKEKTIMISLLLMVNFELAKATWKGKEIVLKPGSMITTFDDIKYIAKSELTSDDIEPALNKFEYQFDFLKLKIDTKAPNLKLIKILNWKQYQQDGLSHEESEQRKKGALKLYDFYISKIEPDKDHRSKKRATSNILKHNKKYSFKDMAIAINNYRPKAINSDPVFRKDPANFFGIHESYFKDYLPGIFDSKKSLSYQESIIQNIPDMLTKARLEELNA